MKRIIAVVFALCLILSGCAFVKPEEGGSPDTQTAGTDSSAPPDVQDETKEPEKPSTALMDSAVKIGELGNLSYFPNFEIEEMTAQEMRLFGNALLLWSNKIGDDGCRTEFKLISLESGELLGKLSITSSGFVTVRTCKDRIGVCDPGLGIVYILDGALGEIETYSPGTSGDYWYLSDNLKTLYQIDWQKGVFAKDLATGTTDSVLINAANIYVRNQTGNYVVLSYIDLNSQRTVCRALNLQTGILERLPVDFDVISAKFTDNVWLIGDSAQWGTYYVISDGQRKTTEWLENRFDLLLPRGQLMTVDRTGYVMSLYDTDGSFISRCEIPEDRAIYIGTDLVWSDVWNGYFFIGVQEDQTVRLMFWDVQKAVAGEDFPLLDETEKGGVSADAALYDRAKKISDRFGVEIRISDQCTFEYGLFSAYEVNDSGYVTQALDMLEEALSKYPGGYFEQLKYDNIQAIIFELIGGLHPKDNSVYEGTYAGITLKQFNCYIVALDAYTICENNVYHEVTHITDDRLAWDAKLREGALFSEDSWKKLLPEGFEYAETYKDLSGSSIWEYVNSGYFVNDYACRYATEDRATMMEIAMMEYSYIYKINPRLGDKLAYYSKCIRDCFNTDGWPEITAWEKILVK